MENRPPQLTDYISHELITIFPSADALKNYYIKVLRQQSRQNRVAANRERLKEKIRLNENKSSSNDGRNFFNTRDAECQTSISIPPSDDNDGSVSVSLYTSSADVDDLSVSDDEENYRNCVIKRINRRGLEYSDNTAHFDNELNRFDDRETKYKSIEEQFVWECTFREGIKEYDSPIFVFCGLKFRMSLMNIDNANKILIFLLDRTKEARVHCVFKIHSLLTTLTRSVDEDFHFSNQTSFHHGIQVMGFDLLTFLEYGKIKFSCLLRTRIDENGDLIGNS